MIFAIFDGLLILFGPLVTGFAVYDGTGNYPLAVGAVLALQTTIVANRQERGQ